MLGAAVIPGPAAVDVAEIPRLFGEDRLPAAGAKHQTGGNPGRETATKGLVMAHVFGLTSHGRREGKVDCGERNLGCALSRGDFVSR
jgi:hypothetical protein